jgi:hypothetical protein
MTPIIQRPTAHGIQTSKRFTLEAFSTPATDISTMAGLAVLSLAGRLSTTAPGADALDVAIRCGGATSIPVGRSIMRNVTGGQAAITAKATR